MDQMRRRLIGGVATLFAVMASSAQAAKKGARRVGGRGSSGKGGRYVGGTSKPKKSR